MLERIALNTLFFYQRYISPLKPPVCRFYPTCSSFMCDAIVKYGLLRGLLKGFRRLLRCHPFHTGGYDPLD